MIPARYAHIAFGLILSGMMSFVVSGIATFRAVGSVPDFVTLWLGAWFFSWAVAFPAVLIAAPIARRLVAKLVRPEPT
ncbi:MAG: DUF2798 domain-containing protein [Pseudomonadota bacterium]